jgi:hypothetical protein
VLSLEVTDELDGALNVSMSRSTRSIRHRKTGPG